MWLAVHARLSDLSSPIALYIRVDRFSMSHENVFITCTVEETSNYSHHSYNTRSSSYVHSTSDRSHYSFGKLNPSLVIYLHVPQFIPMMTDLWAQIWLWCIYMKC